ncbi:peptidylprolyl isomerase [Oscillatoria amoena NRMC-F 0135]|nr:peptidylprolyl isomerase [Oscillatoria amoena NRMC-F 0135]
MMRSGLIILLTLPVASAFSQSKKPPSPDLFVINQRSVLADEFIYLYRKNHPDKKADYTRDKVNQYLELFLNFKLKVEEARARGMDTTTSFLREYNTYRDELLKPYLPESKLVDSLVQLTYARLREEVSAAHILISLGPDAAPADTLESWNRMMEIKRRIGAGEDFYHLASQLSDDPSARSNQGRLGYFTAMQMVFPFESGAYSGKPGEIVGPVRTRFGYHLIKVEDRKPSRGEVEVAHIMVRSGTGRDESKTRDLIFEIFDQLKGGVPWAELCSRYSEDQNSKANGCKLRPFGVGAMASVPEFDRVAFSLKYPGEFSDPFQTAYGWHIILLERKIPLPSFKEIEASLRSRVQRDERVQLSREAVLEKMKDRFSFSENLPFKEQIFKEADSTLVAGHWRLRTWPSNENVFTLKSRSATVQEFLTFVKIHQQKVTLEPDMYVRQLYNQFTESVINRVFEEQIKARNPEYEMLLNEYYEGILLFEIMEQEVWNKASEDSAGQRQYFEQNRLHYTAGERARAVIYSSTVGENMKALKAQLESHDSATVETWVQSKRIRRDAGTFQKADRPVLAQIPWQPGIHAHENSGMYYLARIFEILPAGLATFEEARAAVVSDYQNYLEQKWVTSLKDKFPVSINEKGKKYTTKKLAR